jgi:hypothetical protein
MRLGTIIVLVSQVQLGSNAGLVGLAASPKASVRALMVTVTHINNQSAFSGDTTAQSVKSNQPASSGDTAQGVKSNQPASLCDTTAQGAKSNQSASSKDTPAQGVQSARQLGLIPLALAGIAVIFVYVVGFVRARELNATDGRKLSDAIWWMSPNRVGYRYQSPRDLFNAALFWVCFVFLLSYLVVVLFAPTDWYVLSTPGLLFAFVAAFVSFWSLANTHMIAVRQRHTFTKFDRLRHEMQTVVNEISMRSQRGEEAPERFYMVDYGPRIGEVSQFSIAKEVDGMIKKLAACQQCNTHLIFLPNERLRSVYERLMKDEKDPAKLDEYLQRSEQAIAHHDVDLVAIWRSDKIQNEHYVISLNKALEYIVLPREEGGKNEVAGDITLESNRIDLLYRRAENYLRDAITPGVPAGQRVLKFTVAQTNISRIEVVTAGSREQLQEQLRSPIRSEDIEIVIPVDGTLDTETSYWHGLIPAAGWIAVRLVKRNADSSPRDVCSVFSHGVRIPVTDSLPAAGTNSGG